MGISVELNVLVVWNASNVVFNEVNALSGRYQGIVVDTHVKRLARRLGLTDQKDPDKIEGDLMALFPRQQWRQVGNALIRLGRQYCRARNPDHHSCPLRDICPRHIGD